MNYYSRAGMEFKTVGINRMTTFGKTEFEITRIVFSTVQELTSVSCSDIMSSSRKKEIRIARQLSHYFLRKYTQLSTSEVGKITSNDHSTVLHSCKTVERDIKFDSIYRVLFERVESEINIRLVN